MCATVNKYEKKIDKLHHTIYPQISELLNEIICYRNLYNYEGLDEMVKSLYKEFNSLSSFEEKLVFPAITSLFRQDAEKDFFPNIPEIIKLTGNKVAKIKTYLAEIKNIVLVDRNHYSNDFEKDILQLLHLFDDAYFPAKHRWNAMLQMLNPDEVKCKNRDNGNCKCDSKKGIKIQILVDKI